MWKESQSKPADNLSTSPGARSNLGGSAEQGPGSRRLRWWVAAAATLMLLITLMVIGQPDGDSLEAKVSKILEPIRREERNQKGIYQLAARLEDMPQPLPKLGRWIRDEDDRVEDRDVTEELLLLGDEAGSIVLRLLAEDRSPAVRARLCGVAIQFENIDPLPILTNLIGNDPEALVRAYCAAL